MASVKTSGSITAVISGTITGATQADPVVLTVTGHGLATGDNLLVSGVVGMTEINDTRFTITNINANTFSLDGEDGTGHAAYSSDGTVTEIQQLLATVTAEGQYQLIVDVVNMVDADVLELRIFGKARSGDTERQLYFATFAHNQTDDLKASLPTVSPHHNRFTLSQTAGTGRAFPWAVYEID